MSPFVKIAIGDTMLLFGIVDSDPLVDIFARQLSSYPEEVVLAAIERCQREITHRPANLLAAIVERIEETRTDGWPTPNEAWAAVGTTDEHRTLVCVEQAFEALADVSQRSAGGGPSLLESDAVGARMAFLESYKRKVAAAKAAQHRPAWSVRLGYDKAGREAALSAAVQAGRLPEKDARHLLGEHLGRALPAPAKRLQLAGATAAQRTSAADLRAGEVQKVIAALADPAIAKAAIEERRLASQRVYRVVDGRAEVVPDVEVPLAEIAARPQQFVPPDRFDVAAQRGQPPAPDRFFQRAAAQKDGSP